LTKPASARFAPPKQIQQVLVEDKKSSSEKKSRLLKRLHPGHNLNDSNSNNTTRLDTKKRQRRGTITNSSNNLTTEDNSVDSGSESTASEELDYHDDETEHLESELSETHIANLPPVEEEVLSSSLFYQTSASDSDSNSESRIIAIVPKKYRKRPLLAMHNNHHKLEKTTAQPSSSSSNRPRVSGDHGLQVQTSEIKVQKPTIEEVTSAIRDFADILGRHLPALLDVPKKTEDAILRMEKRYQDALDFMCQNDAFRSNSAAAAHYSESWLQKLEQDVNVLKSQAARNRDSESDETATGSANHINWDRELQMATAAHLTQPLPFAEGSASESGKSEKFQSTTSSGSSGKLSVPPSQAVVPDKSQDVLSRPQTRSTTKKK